MTTYESEIRFLIPNIKVFEKRLKELNAEIVYEYEFSDHYFRPKTKEWNLLYKTIKIRECFKPEKKCEVLFNKAEIVNVEGFIFKRSVYPQGKVKLFEGKFDLCETFLDDLEFENWFTIEKKNCKLMKIPKYDFKTVYEFVNNLGWTGELEIEGGNPEKVKEKLSEWIKILKIEKNQITYKPLSLIHIEGREFV